MKLATKMVGPSTHVLYPGGGGGGLHTVADYALEPGAMMSGEYYCDINMLG